MCGGGSIYFERNARPRGLPETVPDRGMTIEQWCTRRNKRDRIVLTTLREQDRRARRVAERGARQKGASGAG